MEKKLGFLLLLLYSLCFSQVRIGSGNAPITSSEVLVIGDRLPTETKNRGVLIPRVNLISETDVVTVPNPALGLMLYNKNLSRRGFFYWTGTKWERLFDKRAVLELIVPATNELSSSNSGANQQTATGGAVGYQVGLTNGEGPGTRWKALPGLSKTLVINSATNTTTITGSGTIQINNTTVTSADQVHSFAIGIFVNNRLYSVRPYVLNGRRGMTCLTDSFDIKVNAHNLPVGSYDISVYATTRNQLSGGTDIILNWDMPAGTCTNLNAFMTQGILTTQNQQF